MVLTGICNRLSKLNSGGLVFQGETTQIGDVRNDNFLGIMELIGKYDYVTREHLAKCRLQISAHRVATMDRICVDTLVEFNQEDLEKNEFAIFSPCGAHSLNRVGVNTAKLNHDLLTFFGNIESFYSLLKQHVPLSLQSLSETLWSERLQVVFPIVKHYPSILKVLDLLLEDTVTILTTLVRKHRFQGFLISFWHKVLSAIDQKIVIVQGKGMSLNDETQLIKDLLDEIKSLRYSWEIILQESKVVAEAVGISSHFVTRRRPNRLPNADENTFEEKLLLGATNESKSSVIFPVLYFIMADLKIRFASSELICNLFSPILTMGLDITVSTAKRYFSRMANSLKTWQRSTTGQNRLNHLTILGIENELAKSVDFSDVIDHFIQEKPG
ncbi:hypothetical protein PR048_001262, partial [Dryococelus australis]